MDTTPIEECYDVHATIDELLDCADCLEWLTTYED